MKKIKSSLQTYFTNHPLPNVQIKTIDTGSEFTKRIFSRCEKTDSLVLLARFSKQTFANNNEDIDKWVKDFDPHVSLIYADKKDCNDQELISRLDTSTIHR